mmetsp:Transcript_42195/g.68007  ORF Transcript_42195/g.68007 Transcript_42195/m.68007 type:complete len:85 (-) Transcript_42195:236-490(-)
MCHHHHRSNFARRMHDVRHNLKESLVKYLEAEPYVFFNKDFHIGDTHAKVIDCDPSPSLFDSKSTRVTCHWTTSKLFSFTAEPQ